MNHQIQRSKAVRLPTRMSDWLMQEQDGRQSREVAKLAPNIEVKIGQVVGFDRKTSQAHPLTDADWPTLAQFNAALTNPSVVLGVSIDNYAAIDDEQEIVIVVKNASIAFSGLTWPASFFTNPLHYQFAKLKFLNQMVNIAPQSTDRVGFCVDSDYAGNFMHGMFDTLIGAAYYSAQLVHKAEWNIRSLSTPNGLVKGFNGIINNAEGNRYQLSVPVMHAGQTLMVAIGGHGSFDDFVDGAGTPNGLTVTISIESGSPVLSFASANMNAPSTQIPLMVGDLIDISVNENADVHLVHVTSIGTADEDSTTYDIESTQTIPDVKLLLVTAVDPAESPNVTTLNPVVFVAAGAAIPLTP